jgi:16S rRNA processing protein RimM
MTADYPWRPERVRVGTVGRAHALDGRFRVSGPCGWWSFAVGTDVLVDGTPHRIVRSGGDDAAPLIALEGVTDRSGAEALRGAALELPRAEVPEPEPDAYFHFDLVGCTVEDAAGLAVGTVSAVESGVAHDVLVLDGDRRIPFVAAVVPTVDVPGRRLGLAEDFRPG